MQIILPLLLLLLVLPNCANAQAPFAKGTDVSWVTQMERAGRVFYDEAGTQQNLFQLLHEHDLHTFRLRVWIHPAGG